MNSKERKKKILVFFPVLPYPFSMGGNQAMFNGIAAIKEDCDVHVIYVSPIHNSCEHLQKKMQSLLNNKVTFIPFKYNPLKSFYRASIFFRNIVASFLKVKKKDKSYEFSLLPDLYKPISQEYIDFVKDYIEAKHIDIVQFEMLSCLFNAVSLPVNVKKIFVHHELGYVVNEQKMKSEGFSEYNNANVNLAKILEIGLLNKCDAIVTLSEIDKRKLVDEGVKTPIYSSVAVVNTNAEFNNPSELDNVLSFVGPSSHIPNIIGVTWFLENCWGRLLQQDDSYCFKIIGDWSSDICDEFARKYKNVKFEGFVPNLADALNNTIMVVPITVGSGIRMKILEAASLGVPFVSTTVGAEGLPFECGVDCLKGDTPEEFVDAVLRMRDKNLRVGFAKKANKLVKEMYSMEALRKNRLEIYEKVMNGDET